MLESQQMERSSGPKRNEIDYKGTKRNTLAPAPGHIDTITNNAGVRTRTMANLHEAPETLEVHGEKSEGSKLGIFIGILKR